MTTTVDLRLRYPSQRAYLRVVYGCKDSARGDGYSITRDRSFSWGFELARLRPLLSVEPLGDHSASSPVRATPPLLSKLRNLNEKCFPTSFLKKFTLSMCIFLLIL